MSNMKQISDQYGFAVECTPMDELRTIEPVRLAGATYVGNTLDQNFWTPTTVAGGAISQTGGEVLLTTGSTANGSAIITSVMNARYTGGSANRFRGQVQIGDTGATNNIRKWGMFDNSNGAYFKVLGGSMYTATLKGSVETAVIYTSWSNVITMPTWTNINTYEIYITNAKVYFVIAGQLVHTASFPTSPWTNTTNLPVRLENTNSGGSVNNLTLKCRVATIYRLGKLETDTVVGRITTAGTQVLKYNAGRLHRITLNDPAGTLIHAYDGLVSGGGPLLIKISAPAQANPVTLEYGIPFSTGLVIVSTGTWDATVVYE